MGKWVRSSEARLTAVFRESTKLVVRQAQVGEPHIPVDTGFARSSIRASLSEMPPIDPSAKGSPDRSYPYDQGEVLLVINQAQAGQTIYVGWTAAYVAQLEKGHSQQAPEGFVRLAAMQWPQIVSATVQRLKSRSGVPEDA